MSGEAQYPKDGQCYCSSCKQTLTVNVFGKLHDGFQHKCKPCRAIIRQRWYENNKAKHRASVKAYQQTEAGKATGKRYAQSERGKELARKYLAEGRYKHNRPISEMTPEEAEQKRAYFRERYHSQTPEQKQLINAKRKARRKQQKELPMNTQPQPIFPEQIHIPTYAKTNYFYYYRKRKCEIFNGDILVNLHERYGREKVKSGEEYGTFTSKKVQIEEIVEASDDLPLKLKLLDITNDLNHNRSVMLADLIDLIAVSDAHESQLTPMRNRGIDLSKRLNSAEASVLRDLTDTYSNSFYDTQTGMWHKMSGFIKGLTLVQDKKEEIMTVPTPIETPIEEAETTDSKSIKLSKDVRSDGFEVGKIYIGSSGAPVVCRVVDKDAGQVTFETVYLYTDKQTEEPFVGSIKVHQGYMTDLSGKALKGRNRVYHFNVADLSDEDLNTVRRACSFVKEFDSSAAEAPKAPELKLTADAALDILFDILPNNKNLTKVLTKIDGVKLRGKFQIYLHDKGSEVVEPLLGKLATLDKPQLNLKVQSLIEEQV